MIEQQIWAPWRLTYVRDEKPPGCPFCVKPAERADEAALIVARGEHCFVVLNLFPYNPGHLMVIPYRHVADLTDLSDEELAESTRMLRDSVIALREALAPGPNAFNVGLNMGEAAGAGIAAHLHWHLVPRWNGDTNFMPLLAETKVIAQHLETTWELVRAGFAKLGYEIDDSGEATTNA